MVQERNPDGSIVEKLCDQGAQLVLREFEALPDVVSDSHVPMLGLAHQLVELQESHRMLSDSSTPPDFTIQHRKWRQRLPNDFEGDHERLSTLLPCLNCSDWIVFLS